MKWYLLIKIRNFVHTRTLKLWEKNDFVEYLIDNPNEIENLPDNFILEFVGKDFPKIEKKEEKDLNSLLIKKYVKVKNSFELIK